MACRCISKRAAKITLCILLPFIAVSIGIIIKFSAIYSDILRSKMNLAKGSPVTDMWMDIPFAIYEKLYFFNITNKEAFLNGSEPLNVVEVGPYTYKARFLKKFPQWNDNNTVSFRETRTFHFDPGMSNGTEEDEIYSLNGPMIILSSIVKDYNVNLKGLLSFLLAVIGESVVIKRSIKELAYGGYEDIIIKLAPILKPDIPMKNGIFSWLHGQNDTNDGLFTVYTGVDDISKLNIINNWNGEETLPFWKGDTCNMINGTNIEIGPPLLDSQETYQFFQTIFCRSLVLSYTGDQRHFDILSKRFVPTYSLFANSSENPDNYCFEMGKERPSGIFHIGRCQFDAPIFISFPHFYLADPSYLDPVVGLSPPTEEDHGSFVDVEVTSGFSIQATVRFQMNVELIEVEGIFQTYNVSKGVFPILWAELTFAIDENLANFLKSHLFRPKTIAYYAIGVTILFCSVLAVVLLIYLCIGKPDFENDSEVDPLIDAMGNDCEKVQTPKACCRNISKSQSDASPRSESECNRKLESLKENT